MSLSTFSPVIWKLVLLQERICSLRGRIYISARVPLTALWANDNDVVANSYSVSSIRRKSTVALFARLELSCWRVAVFGTWYVFLRTELSWLGNSTLQRKQRFSATDMLVGICTCEIGIIFDERTHGQTLGKHNTSPLTCGGVWILHIRDAFFCGFKDLCIIC